MPRFSIRNPYFIVVICLALAVIGINALLRMPVDLFPPINLPVVVVATFYNGMPPKDIEIDYHQPAGAVFHASERCGSHGVALTVGREHHQGVLPAGYQRGCGRDAIVEPGAGRSEASAARHAASAGAEVRRIQPAGRVWSL